MVGTFFLASFHTQRLSVSLINDAAFLLGHFFPFFLDLFRFMKGASLVFQDVYALWVNRELPELLLVPYDPALCPATLRGCSFPGWCTVCGR